MASEAIFPRFINEIIGHRFEYTYANGWRYEMYVKNATTIDYLIHSGMVGGRRVKGQRVDLIALKKGVYKISWTEPTGTSVCVTLVPAEHVLHGVIFFPRWVKEHPERTVLFQNNHLDRIRAYRNEGPTYPIHVVSEFARITAIEYVGADNEQVVPSSPG
ncbi:phenolic acid decarboxylase [Streptomyces sp. NPDC005876]|uniref:phenolic acid decarboxylase n=1 Tax=Streptomyces sp. NPDC005876 TaxID=3157076 RepID=UPI0033CFB9F1